MESSIKTMNSLKTKIENLFMSQIQGWDIAQKNYELLGSCKTRKLSNSNFSFILQKNYGRIKSSTSKTDEKSLKARPCFLCKSNRPFEQKDVKYKGETNSYEILVNPFPIFQKHFTIVSSEHTNQTIKNREKDLLELTDIFEDYIVFFNGANCGASAPDHMHFQAGKTDILPIVNNFADIEKYSIQIETCKTKSLYSIMNMPFTGFYIKSENEQDVYETLKLLLKELGEDKKLNIISWKKNNYYIIVIFPRIKHRPSIYFANDSKRKLISPASVEMSGLIITPIEKDFLNTNYSDLLSIFKEICYSKNQIESVIQKITKNQI